MQAFGYVICAWSLAIAGRLGSLYRSRDPAEDYDGTLVAQVTLMVVLTVGALLPLLALTTRRLLYLTVSQNPAEAHRAPVDTPAQSTLAWRRACDLAAQGLASLWLWVILFFVLAEITSCEGNCMPSPDGYGPLYLVLFIYMILQALPPATCAIMAAVALRRGRQQPAAQQLESVPEGSISSQPASGGLRCTKLSFRTWLVRILLLNRVQS